MDYARSNIIFLICLVFAATFPDVEAHCPPIWKTKLHNVTLYDGQQNYTLDCQAYGFPPAHHRWTKNGSQINDEDVSIGRNDLSFRVARTRHTGWYTCIANNVHGTLMQSVYVEVVNDPSIIIQPESASVGRGKSVTLSCGIIGSTAGLAVMWTKTKNKKDWKGDALITYTNQTRRNVSIFSLTIKTVNSRHRGKYRCRVKNAQGSAKSSAAKVSKTRSATPLSVIAVRPFINTTEGSDVELECIFNDSMTSGITWYKDRVKLTYKGDGVIVNNKHKAFLTLTQVAPSVAGKYVCKGSSPSGSAEANISLVVKGIPDAPTNVTVKSLSPSVVLISWVPEFDGGATCWFNVQFKKSQNESEWTVPMRINTTTAKLKNPDGWDGVFVFRVTAVNQFGCSVPRILSVKLKENKNNGRQKQREDGSSSTGALVGGVIGGVVFVALVIVMVFVLRRQKRKSPKTPQKQLPAVAYAVVDQENNIYATTDATDANVYTTDANVDTTANPQQRSDTYSYASIKLDAAAAMATGQLEYASVQKPKQWELPKSNVRLDKKLGSGHFGQVMKGFLKTKQGTRVVAVKMLKENADQQQKKEFLAELELMKTMSPHPNIVGLVGCCTKSDEPFIIVEYCSLGNLRDFLRSSHGSVIYANLAGNSLTLTCLDLLSFAWQCARGMSYLASQKVVHRDLAARNILVDKGHVCKIADFGLARDIYEKKQYLKLGEADLPLRWMAIESIFQGITTTLSDVWSFGILLWEIVTLGANPYPAMKRDDLIEQLRVGYRMPKPPFCSDELYAIMWQCWQTDPESRPTFLELGKTLHRLKTAKTLPIDLGNYDRSYINATEDD